MRFFNSFLIIIFLISFAYAQKPENTPTPAIKNALELLQENKFVEAEKILREAVKKEPRNLSANVLLGTLLIQTSKVEEGIIYLKNVLKISPNHIQANYNLALVFSAQGKNKLAIPYLEKASGISARVNTPQTNDTALLLALTRAYISENRTSDAAKIVEKLEKIGSRDIRVLFTLGLLLAD